jgi:hypothetical protein
MFFTPRGKFKWPDSKANSITRMQSGKLIQDQLDEMVGGFKSEVQKFRRASGPQGSGPQRAVDPADLTHKKYCDK